MASDLARLTDTYEPEQSTVNLAQLTDYAPQGVTPDADGVRRVLITKPSAASDGMDYVDQPLGADVNASVGSKVDDILNKLTGANGQERYQLWPEKVVRGGLSAAGDALAGNVPQWAVDKDTGEVHTSPQMIEKAQEISALAGTGGLAGGADATLGSTAFLRPALKYKDKLYKGKEGQQHLDVIPKDLYPEFERMAMSGEDLAHYNFGFMNHKGQFLDREKALKYAIDEGIVDAHAGQYGALTSTLMADSSKPGTAIEAMKANPFYSAVERNVKASNQDKMTGEQWLGTLSNKPGVKPEELQWTGLGEFLKENSGKPVTKAQIDEHLQNNKIELKEVNKGFDAKAKEQALKDFEKENDRIPFGDEELTSWANNKTKYHSYQLPGGENYREMLLTLPKNSLEPVRAKVQANGLRIEELRNQMYGTSGTNEIRAEISKLQNENIGLRSDLATSKVNEYKSSHWDEPNILAHVRMNDRTIDGKKSLHLEEIQSDWHQQGRTAGYDDPKFRKAAEEKLEKAGYPVSGEDARMAFRDGKITEEEARAIGAKSSIPDAPFKKSWHELALKRMIREAAEKGYDRLSWTPGEAQAARYDLSKSVDKLAYDPKTGHLQGFKDGGMAMDNKVTKDKLADFVGKEAADKLLNKPTKVLGNGYHTLENADLKIGGEGMKGFYNQIIPKTLEKFGKEHGVKVKQTNLQIAKVHELDKKLKENGYDPDSVDLQHILEDHGGRLPFWLSNAEADAIGHGEHGSFYGVEKQPIHYIELPQSLKDQAIRKGFPLFSAGVPIDLLDNK